MMWARFIATIFIFTGGIGCARSDDQTLAGMESCFQEARVAGAICSKLPDDPARRVDCFQKARAAQLECLEHVLPDTRAEASAPQESLQSRSSRPPVNSTVAETQQGPLDLPNRTITPATSPKGASPETISPEQHGSSSAADLAAPVSSAKEATLKQADQIEAPARLSESSLLQLSNSQPNATSGPTSAERTELSSTTDAAAQDNTKNGSFSQAGSTGSPTEGSLPQQSDSSLEDIAETTPRERMGSASAADAAAQDNTKNGSFSQTGSTGSPTEGSLPQQSNSSLEDIAETTPRERMGSASAADTAAPIDFANAASLTQAGRIELATPTESNSPQTSNSQPNATPGTSSTQPSASDAAAQDSTKNGSLKQAGSTASPATSTERDLIEQSNDLQSRPGPSPSAETTLPANPAKDDGSPKQLGAAGSSVKSMESSPPQNLRDAPKANPEQTLPPSSPDANSLALKPAEHLPRPTGTDWVVSETTSPIDYSPLVTASIRSTSNMKDGPSTLSIRCLGRRTELQVRTDGVWVTTPSRELRGKVQINNQAIVEQRWILSSDGRTATYREDPVDLLRSLPDNSQLKISLADHSSPSHEATFRLDGLNAARKKVAATCKWPPIVDRVSSDKR
jgi:Type VI secretion system VasI, EvfG, VC_A0118